MENSAVRSNSADGTEKQEWSDKCATDQYTIMPRKYVVRSSLSLLGLFLTNLLTKSSMFSRCMGFSEGDSSCYGTGALFAVICAFRLAFTVIPTIYMIRILISLKKERIKSMLPYIIISIALAMVAIVYFVGILHEVF